MTPAHQIAEKLTEAQARMAGATSVVADAETARRFWSKVDVRADDECWPWLGYLNEKGYGRFYKSSKNHSAHRFAVMLSGREIPDGMVCDHLCRRRDCVNPAHVEVVTIRQNVVRGVAGLKDGALYPDKEQYCPQGHERTEENTIFRYDGGRECRPCKVATDAKYKARWTKEKKDKESYERRKLVNGILTEILSPYESDPAKLTEVGNSACTKILDALAGMRWKK